MWLNASRPATTVKSTRRHPQHKKVYSGLYQYLVYPGQSLPWTSSQAFLPPQATLVTSSMQSMSLSTPPPKCVTSFPQPKLSLLNKSHDCITTMSTASTDSLALSSPTGTPNSQENFGKHSKTRGYRPTHVYSLLSTNRRSNRMHQSNPSASSTQLRQS